MSRTRHRTIEMRESPAASDDWTLRTLIDGLSNRGEAPALIAVKGETVRPLACAALAERVRSLASGLLRLGIVPGEPVALLAPNGPDWVVARLGLGAVGAVAVALDDLATEAEHRSALADSGCRRALTSAAHVSMLRSIDPQLELTVVSDGSTPNGTRSWTELFAAPAESLPSLPSQAPAMLV